MSPYRFKPVHLLFRYVLPLFIGLFILNLPGTAASQPEQDEQAAAASGIEFQPRLGEYHYEITWGLNHIGKGVIAIEREGENYILRAEKKTTGLLDRIYQLRYAGEARIKAEDLSPVESIVIEENRKRKKVQVTQYPTSEETDTVKVTETKSRRDKEKVKTKEFEFVSDTLVVDMFSAIFLARSFDWQVGERHEFTVFAGSKKYLVNMDCIGETMFSVGDETLAAWVIQPTFRRLNEEDSTFTHEDTLVYLSADESKDIIKVKSKLGIGTVKLRFVKYMQ